MHLIRQEQIFVVVVEKLMVKGITTIPTDDCAVEEINVYFSAFFFLSKEKGENVENLFLE